ncbi:hypothetical protein ACFVSS_21985 [Peribacillus butanolivorans]|uniref:hypothetical protein n=1 Tax=Peribacillus butanolivorans TaxID=421767 RepID=UPI00366C6534
MFLNMYMKEMKDALRDRRTLILSVLLPILLLTGLTLFYHFPPEDSLFKRVKGESPTVRGR